MEQEE
jgi:hypothetical protein